MVEEKFRLPYSSYDELTKIIRAYGHVKESATLKDVSERVAIATTTVSSNNGFLLAIGVIEGGHRKTMTDAGASLAHALEYEGMPAEIGRCWRAIVSESDFMEKVLAAVKIRKGMDLSTLQTHIAFSAGKKPGRAAATGANTVISILKSAELIREEDGKIVSAEPAEFGEVDMPQGGSPAPAPTGESPHVVEPALNMPPRGVISIELQLHVECKPEDLEGLGRKLRKLLDQISEDSVELPDSDGR
ncbi:hypothetical protein KAW64_06410 [bacterium]|nr:hypothetical protein [bacterium]